MARRSTFFTAFSATALLTVSLAAEPARSSGSFLGGVDGPPADAQTPELQETTDKNLTPNLRVLRDEFASTAPSTDSSGSVAPANVEPVRMASPYRGIAPISPVESSARPALPPAVMSAAGIDTRITGTDTKNAGVSVRVAASTLPPLVESSVAFFSSPAKSQAVMSQQIINPNGRGWVSTETFPQGLRFETCGVYFFDLVYRNGALQSDRLVASSLSIESNASNPFTIVVASYNGGGNEGALPGSVFDATRSQQWTLVSAGTVTGFSSDKFVIDATRFKNDIAGGSFSIAQAGNDLVLNFTPVPEPSTWVLMGGGMGFVAALSLRRRLRG